MEIILIFSKYLAIFPFESCNIDIGPCQDTVKSQEDIGHTVLELITASVVCS